MFKLHLKLFLRNAKKYKTTFLIKVFGLSTALCCVLLIALWVFDELGFDKFHEKDAEIYQLIEFVETNGTLNMNSSTSGLLSETVAAQFPEIEYATSLRFIEDVPLAFENKEIKKTGIFASNDLFNIFSFPLVKGNIEDMLITRNSIVLSKSLAMTLFGSLSDVIGKTIEFKREETFTISGIFDDTPANSSLKFDFVISYAYAKATIPSISNWDYNTVATYASLKEGVSAEAFNKKIENVIKENNNGDRVLSTRRFSSSYLYGIYENGKQVSGRIQYVRLFSLIALLILIIACINYMNLATADANRRLKEIGIKKVIGSTKKALTVQYLSESLLTMFSSLVIAVLLVFAVLPSFNELTGKALEFSPSLSFIYLLLVILLVTGIVAGSYPAFYLSRQRTLNIIKGKFQKNWADLFARKGLVVFQFSVSIILIAGVFIINKQLEYLQDKNLGYSKDNIVYFDIEGNINENLDSFLTSLAEVEGVQSASSIGTNIVGGNNTFNSLSWPGKSSDEKVVFQMRPVNFGMLETLDIKVLEGRSFSRDFGAEDLKIIFNEAAVKTMGLKDPIGQTISIQGTNLEIIGVTENFHFDSLHEEIKPLFFVLRPAWTHEIMAKLNGVMLKTSLENLTAFYQEYNPNITFDYTFLDQAYDAQYKSEEQLSKLSRIFAFLAIIISCLGLFGLAIFTAENRRKEIGIRKVLGQSTAQITIMLSNEFAKLVVFAACIALPLAYLLANDWLTEFAYRISLQVWQFIAAGFLALFIALLTVSFQAIKAATANPVKSLRTE